MQNGAPQVTEEMGGAPRWKRGGRLCGVAALLLGLVGLFGWLIGHPSLAGFVPRYAPMAPDSSVALAILGAGVIVAGAARRRPVSNRVLRTLALFVLVW